MISTNRLYLRPVQASDLDKIHLLHSDPEVDKYNTLGIPKSTEITQRIVDQFVKESFESPSRKQTLVIEEKSTSDFIGLFGISLGGATRKNAEVWYKLLPKNWGVGYATEALDAALNYGFDQLDLHRIEAGCAVENYGSIRVLEKAGMILEGRRRQTLPLKSGWSDNFDFAILKEDWVKANQSN